MRIVPYPRRDLLVLTCGSKMGAVWVSPTSPRARPPLPSSPLPTSQWSDAGSTPEAGISPEPSLLLPSLGSPTSSRSALLYMNADFEGGEFIFTEMDAKTVTVSRCSAPNAVPQQPVAPTLQRRHAKSCWQRCTDLLCVAQRLCQAGSLQIREMAESHPCLEDC